VVSKQIAFNIGLPWLTEKHDIHTSRDLCNIAPRWIASDMAGLRRRQRLD